MDNMGIWGEQLFRETTFVVLLFILVIYILFIFLFRNNKKYRSGWASLKSWLITAPVLFLFAGLPAPLPLYVLVGIAILAAKTYFMMTGMYHRSWFIWLTYLFIAALGYCIHMELHTLYNVMPMLFLGALCFIPLLRDSAKHMIQYIALSMLAFMFWGWGFLHLARFINMEQGIYIVIYLGLLMEFCESVALGTNRISRKFPLFKNITNKVSVESILVSTFFTVLLAWGMRHLLPDRSEKYWLAAGLTVALLGRMGGLVVSVIRKDLKIKDTGVFIIGRNDILSRLDKPVFVAPVLFYIFLYFQNGL